MNTDESWRTLGQNLAMLTVVMTFTASLAGCGGSSGGNPVADTASTSGTSSGGGSSSSSGGGSSGSSGGGSSSSSGGGSSSSSGGGSSGSSGGGSSGSSGGGSSSSSGGGSSSSSGGGIATILFEQPQESGIGGHLVVPLATHTAPPNGVFTLVLWQPNPFVSNGQLVPTAWDAGTVTGFTPASPLTTMQLGFQPTAGSSTAQMDAATVGAYLNSADLPGSPAGQKMMITPQFTFAAGSEPVPFSSANSVLSGSMDLQIPTAVGNDTYVNADFSFIDPNGVRISMGIEIFHNGATNPVLGSGYDTPSNTYMLNSPLGVDQRFVTRVSGSGSATGVPWQGWQHFEWSISQAQFVAAINYLDAAFPGKVKTTDPTQYVLAEIHLNAEFHFQPDPAELGWSMQGWKVWTSN